MSDKLSDCPFCGSEAETEKIEDGCYGVGCPSCDFQLMSGNVGIGWHASEAEAIAAWNRRASHAPAIPAVDSVAIRDAALEAAAAAVEDHQRAGREWINESLWGALSREAAARIRALKAAPAISESEDARDAARYRLLRRGQRWSVINGIGDTLRAEELDTAVDAARKGEKS
ncbi:hypothetical protein DX980_20055 [Burkholderia gladioli]|uniref:Lar family restriction alleviation protein n=1 Tax=Burkholderia gladioli TaxID=28095 RepID=UPI0013648E45|nr:Lar family restriction alleviation protein [Burkholderia gladioli]KAF1065247.1 hypothetical protein LvStA_03922 [Burkholderia gladioli]WAG21341.1 hypothetical protein DX980_20055 [Burkholderia gladioli]